MSNARNLANLLGTGTTIADAKIAGLTASKLSGALPAISGASLTGIGATSGSTLQVVNGVTPTTATPPNTSEVAIANNTPQPTGFYVLITPSATNSKIIVLGRVTTGVNYSSAETYWEIYRGIGGTTPAYVASISNQTNTATDYSNDWSINSRPLVVYDTPNTTSQVRYEIYARSHSNGHYVYINKSASVSYGTTHMFAMEIKG